MDAVELWTSAAFLRDVERWVADELAGHGVRLTGDWEQPHARVWSSAIRFETTDGRVWFKVNGPGTSHEPALVRSSTIGCPVWCPRCSPYIRRRAGR